VSLYARTARTQAPRRFRQLSRIFGGDQAFVAIGNELSRQLHEGSRCGLIAAFQERQTGRSDYFRCETGVLPLIVRATSGSPPTVEIP
jgi:hypothetical protein